METGGRGAERHDGSVTLSQKAGSELPPLSPPRPVR